MVAVTIVVRKLGRTEPEYSLPFDLPEIPRVGSYLSVFRPENEPHISSDDLVVRHIWWELEYPERSDALSSREDVRGRPRDIIIECDHAIGPYLVKSHREFIEMEANAKGIKVDKIPVSRIRLGE